MESGRKEEKDGCGKGEMEKGREKTGKREIRGEKGADKAEEERKEGEARERGERRKERKRREEETSEKGSNHDLLSTMYVLFTVKFYCKILL